MKNRMYKSCLLLLALAVLLPQARGQELTPEARMKLNVMERSAVPTPRNFAKPLLASQLRVSGKIVTKKTGILECWTDKSCMVMNMPLLNQMDERVDQAVWEARPFGCYDASIVSVIVAAMANRHPAFGKIPLGWRVGQFLDIKPGIGGNGQPAPQEVKQLSYEYGLAINRSKAAEAAKAKGQTPVFQYPSEQPLYFHEVVWTLSNTINEKCNPKEYGNCSEVTNKYGHGFRRFLTASDSLTNESVIARMRAGYVMMIAYARYRPVVKVEKGLKKVSFVGAAANNGYSPHKVVFIGFNEGEKYPLVINDVGNGQQYKVRLTTDLSSRAFSERGNPSATFGKPLFTYPTPVKIYLEYEGEGEGINQQVFFVEHVDGLRVLNASDKFPQ